MPGASQGEIRKEELRCSPSVGPRSGWGRGLAAGFAGDDLRAKSRHFVLCAPKRRLRAAALASSRGLCGAADPKRRARTPALQGSREREPAAQAAVRRAGPGGGSVLASSRGLCGAASLGGPMKIIGPCAGDSGAPQPPSTCHARRPGYAAHLPYIVGRAFTPAGEGKGVTLRFCVGAAPRGPVMPQGREGLR